MRCVPSSRADGPRSSRVSREWHTGGVSSSDGKGAPTCPNATEERQEGAYCWTSGLPWPALRRLPSQGEAKQYRECVVGRQEEAAARGAWPWAVAWRPACSAFGC